ncbi:MAG: glycoside hydrolase family 10 protein [Phocaeicola sp.]
MQRYLLLLSFILTIPLGWAQSKSPKHEVRAVWITTLGGMDWPRQKASNAASIERQKQELRTQLDQYKAAHFNTILLQVRLRGDVIYPSAYETFTESLTGHTGKNPGYDPLAFAIEECHKRGLELHAWLVTIPIGNARQIRVLGNHSVVQKNKKICKQHQGGWYLNPGHPETKHYLAGIVQEIVKQYDVDGIHLDYIRYPEEAEKFPDADTFRTYGKGKELKSWRRENITAIVREIYNEVKATKPWVKVSSSPVGKFQDTPRYTSRGWNAYHTVYQDVQAWLKEGIHDAIFPMMYFRGNHFYPFALDWKEKSNQRWIVPGLGIYFLSPQEQNWPLDEIARQLYFIRGNGLDGQAFFRGRFLLDNTKGVFDELKLIHYTSPALLPPLTWLDNKTPASPTHPLFSLENEELKLSWKPVIESNTTSIVYHIYGSDNYPVDTNDARNLIETNWRKTSYNYAPTQPWLRKRYFAVTAANRYGNESLPLALNVPASHELPLLNQGHTLYLPEALDSKTIGIKTSVGALVWQGNYQRTLSIENLKSGFYQVVTMDAESGTERVIGRILK